MPSKQEMNRKLVVDTFLKNRSVSHRKIAKQLNMANKTVSRIINRFLQSNTIQRNKGSGRKPGPANKKLIKKFRRSLASNPGLSDKDRAIKYNISRSTVQKWRTRFGYKSYKVIKAPNRNDKQNKTAKSRARKLYDKLLTKHDGCILLDDETYVKLDFKQIPGKNYYVSKFRGNVDNKFKYVLVDKYAKKLMIWQAVCSCGRKSDFFITNKTMDGKLYIQECLTRRLKPLITSHKGSVLFWPDLARIHYSKDVLNWYHANNVQYVPVESNPPNCPELRPIEKFWGIMKAKLKKSGAVAKNEFVLRKKWKQVTETYKEDDVRRLMRNIKRNVRRFCKN